jgi:hypothetical protein
MIPSSQFWKEAQSSIKLPMFYLEGERTLYCLYLLWFEVLMGFVLYNLLDQSNLDLSNITLL